MGVVGQGRSSSSLGGKEVQYQAAEVSLLQSRQEAGGFSKSMSLAATLKSLTEKSGGVVSGNIQNSRAGTKITRPGHVTTRKGCRER